MTELREEELNSYTLEWLNDNPDKAVELLPEVIRFLKWKSAPYVFHHDPKTDKTFTGPMPLWFTTRTGREVR